MEQMSSGLISLESPFRASSSSAYEIIKTRLVKADSQYDFFTLHKDYASDGQHQIDRKIDFGGWHEDQTVMLDIRHKVQQ